MDDKTSNNKDHNPPSGFYLGEYYVDEGTLKAIDDYNEYLYYEGIRRIENDLGMSASTWEKKDGISYLYDLKNMPRKFYTEKNNLITHCIMSKQMQDVFTVGMVDGMIKYIYILETKKLVFHWNVNTLIDINNDWDSFKSIRSYNYHGKDRVKGILPICFEILREITEIKIGKGKHVIKFEKF